MELHMNIDYQQDQIAIDDAEHREPPPQCFKLNPDCWEEVFEWLSLHDVHAVGQTCTRLQPVAGLYFQQKYRNLPVVVEDDGIYFNQTQINGFSRFVENIDIFVDRRKPFEYIQSKCNKELKQIFFACETLDATKLECIRGSLNKVEIVQIIGIKNGFHFSLFDDVLKFCHNLKHLSVWGSPEMQMDWLLHIYPNLEYFEFNPEKEVNELTTFFKLNPNIKTIVTSAAALQGNRQSFAGSNMELDDFKLRSNYDGDNIEAIKRYLVELHARGFYKRLHLFDFHESLASLPALIGISLWSEISVFSLNMLRELRIEYGDWMSIEMSEMLAKNLVNLKRVSFLGTHFDCIKPFIRYSTKLREIDVRRIIDIPNGFRDLNQDRIKLAGARKVVIYVEEKLFLETKWANTTTDFGALKVERREIDPKNFDY